MHGTCNSILSLLNVKIKNYKSNTLICKQRILIISIQDKVDFNMKNSTSRYIQRNCKVIILI